jgi:hypothetical protein
VGVAVVGAAALTAVTTAYVACKLWQRGAVRAAARHYGREYLKRRRGGYEEGVGFDAIGIDDPALVPRRELTQYQRDWIARGKIKFPLLKQLTANLLMVASWAGREMSAAENAPPVEFIASQVPIIAFNILAPSRAERALVRMMGTDTYQEGVEEMDRLTSDPAWPAELSVRGLVEWLVPPRRLADQ